jgi:hypothetical protein
MLNSDDRRAIEGLFSRVADVERNNPHRDAEAEQLIDREIVRRPSAPYYLAQTVLVQEHALEVAERRIRELEQKVEDNARRITSDRPRGPWDRSGQDQRNDRAGGWGGGGFLAGAAQTAMGVAGGVLLGSAIGSLFGGGAANAAESPSPESQSDTAADTGSDAGNDQDFGGGDSGDFGGFDMGGDF